MAASDCDPYRRESDCQVAAGRLQQALLLAELPETTTAAAAAEWEDWGCGAGDGSDE
jgi:hypothetical protein